MSVYSSYYGSKVRLRTYQPKKIPVTYNSGILRPVSDGGSGGGGGSSCGGSKGVGSGSGGGKNGSCAG